MALRTEEIRSAADAARKKADPALTPADFATWRRVELACGTPEKFVSQEQRAVEIAVEAYRVFQIPEPFRTPDEQKYEALIRLAATRRRAVSDEHPIPFLETARDQIHVFESPSRQALAYAPSAAPTPAPVDNSPAGRLDSLITALRAEGRAIPGDV